MYTFKNKDDMLVQYYGYGWRGDVVIPDNITSIGENAFCDCIHITSITIPDSVTVIKKRAFWGCSGLTSIHIPDSVTIIGDNVFSDCTNLTSITIPDGITIGHNIFSNCHALKTINGVSVENIPTRWYVYNKLDIIMQKDVFVDQLRGNKYPLIWKMFLIWPENRTVLSYLDKKCTSLCKYLIETNDLDTMQKFLSLKKFISKKNIDILIRYAIDCQKYDMQLMLTDYKKQNIGYDDTKTIISKKFKL